jgi:hypothetical protein
VLGIAVLGTVLSVTYRDRIAPALGGLPPETRTAAESSAEHTRYVAGALGQPDLVAAADRAFVDAMHVTALSAALVALAGAILLLRAFRTRRTITPTPPAPTGVDRPTTVAAH